MAAIAMALTLMAVTAACSDDGDGEGDDVSEPETTTTTVDRPDGPSAELTPLTGGNGINLVAIQPVDLEAAGYVEEEYAVAGTATSYTSEGELPTDGTFELEPDATADYRTRIVVRRPADAADFNGTVVVEWLNVTAGIDANPDWSFAPRSCCAAATRGSACRPSRSASRAGTRPSRSRARPKGGIKAADPERYGDLDHPGDAFAYDIYTQVARALRAPGDVDALDGLSPERVLAVGESQSAFALTTYVNGVQPLTEMFDGFLVHSRGAGSLTLGTVGGVSDMASSIGGPGIQIRTDGAAPVLMLEMEGDVVGLLNYLRPASPTPTRSACGRWPAPPTPTPSSSARRSPASTAAAWSTTARSGSWRGPPCVTSTIGCAPAMRRPKRRGSRWTSQAPRRRSCATRTASCSGASARRWSTSRWPP